ncbi:CPBP family intramembrane glutamic endopeptidase [Kangiella sp. TOML190]|uniref:CPBP family intramembrane glutamic endopeptidase n=1 Tax=Kangiella sp. TOML190 TaxID=2931351 RepID=UPI00203A3990|nr:CPBP family intramembrane glutamic endopeptidase [Kangiella sp. TOML190]
MDNIKSVAWLPVVAWFMLGFYLPGIEQFLLKVGAEWSWYWWDLSYFYYGYFILFIAILIASERGPIAWTSLFQGKMTSKNLKFGIILTIFCFVFSIGTAYLLFYPLSFAAPAFVSYWYLSPSEIIYYDGDTYPLIANLLSLIALVVLPSILEEFAFRGVMLKCWSKKWGFWKATLVSSSIFAILHPDPIGAFGFGVAMCYLYARFNTLLIPIICHALNNFFVWVWELVDTGIYGPEDIYTLLDFQNSWFLGLIALVISIAWAKRYWSSESVRQHLKSMRYPT